MNSTKKREVRRFGIVAALFFGALCVLGIWTKRPIPTVLFGSLSLLGVAFVLIPGPMRPVHALWLKAAHFVGTMVTLAVLTLAYYTVITPAALIKRVLGGRPLPLGPDADANSYWVERKEPAQPTERFSKRF